MRIRRAVVALTLALSAVACQPSADPCKVASGRSTTHAEWIREASLDGATGPELTAYCRSLLVDGEV